jgi:acetylornithine deacetylase
VDAELAIVCHTDTVPFGSEWAGATDRRGADDALHCCGACDVKGFLSRMLAVVRGLDVTQLRRRLCLVFTSDEEDVCRGARFLLGQQALRAHGMQLSASQRRLFLPAQEREIASPEFP